MAYDFQGGQAAMSGKDLMTREAREKDCRELAVLATSLLTYEHSLHPEMGALTPWAGSESEMLKQMRQPGTRFFVAERDGALVGYVKVVLHGAPPSGLVEQLRRIFRIIQRQPRPNVESVGGLIPGIFVRESERGTGTGRRLVEAAEAWLRSRGMVTSNIHVLYANIEGRQFWNAQGYEPIVVGLRKRLE